VARDSLISLGWRPDMVLFIGSIELGCLLLYLWPRASVLGAVLMTGLLGGAVASQLRVEAPLFSHVLFGVYLGAAMWGGLWLRHPGLRRLFPLQRRPAAGSAAAKGE
jgi:hypothetical protein